MNIHEYQAKKLLSAFNVPVGQGEPAETIEEAIAVAKELGGSIWVVKAQIHAGGRGLAGGVKVCKTIDEVQTYSKSLLDSTLVTHQTGPKGQKVRKIYVSRCFNCERILLKLSTEPKYESDLYYCFR